MLRGLWLCARFRQQEVEKPRLSPHVCLGSLEAFYRDEPPAEQEEAGHDAGNNDEGNVGDFLMADSPDT